MSDAKLVASVVVPSYEGSERVKRLLEQLARQCLPADQFEVLVVDDGSPTPLASRVDPSRYPFRLTLLRQENSGAAVARHRGALAAGAPVLIFIDDDMQVSPVFVAAHACQYEKDEPLVVLGRIHGPKGVEPALFERWHQTHLERKADRFARGAPIPGKMMFTGNVSMRRCDYLAVGGFDPSLRRGHDAELGLRLEKQGVRFTFCEEAWSAHGPEDHPLKWWRDRAMLYGRVDQRIFRKHPDVPYANPWRVAKEMGLKARPFVELAVRAPDFADRVGAGVLKAAQVLDGVGQRKLAHLAVTLGYTIDYYRGLRLEIGSTREALEAARRSFEPATPAEPAPARKKRPAKVAAGATARNELLPAPAGPSAQPATASV